MVREHDSVKIGDIRVGNRVGAGNSVTDINVDIMVNKNRRIYSYRFY